MEKSNLLVGKTFWKFYPEYIFGELIFNYWKFKIIKIFEKNAQVQTLEQYGVTHSGNISLERLDSYFFKSEKQGISWNKNYIKNSIEHFEKELKGYTKLNEKYQEIKDDLFLLKGYLKILDNFSLDKVKKFDEKFESTLNKMAKYKPGERIMLIDEKNKKGIIESVSVRVRTFKGLHDEKITYSVKFDNGDWYSSVGESKIKLIKGGNLK